MLQFETRSFVLEETNSTQNVSKLALYFVHVWFNIFFSFYPSYFTHYFGVEVLCTTSHHYSCTAGENKSSTSY
jgi:hypothetical protein